MAKKKPIQDVSEKDWRSILGLNNKESRGVRKRRILGLKSLASSRIEKRGDSGSESRDTLIETDSDSECRDALIEKKKLMMKPQETLKFFKERLGFFVATNDTRFSQQHKENLLLPIVSVEKGNFGIKNLSKKKRRHAPEVDSVCEPAIIDDSPLPYDSPDSPVYKRLMARYQNLRKDKPPSGFPIHPLISNLPPTANQLWPERGSSARGGWREEYKHTRFGPADFDGDRVVSHGREAPAEFSMKILCPAAKIGGVIGNGASNVRQVQQETGTDIHFYDVSGDSEERVIRVSAYELLVGKSKGFARSRLGLKFRLMKKKKSNKTRFRAKKKSRIYLDGSFLFHCFVHKMDIRNINVIKKGMKFEIATTDCTWKELACFVNQFTEHSIKSIYISMKKQVETINCRHKDNLHAQDCIMSLVGGNENKALIASHDSDFLQKLSENPLIPVVVIEGGDFALKCLSKNHRREYLCFPEPAEERLMNRMKLYEFKHVEVMGDGNCLLRALSEQITHDEHKHKRVRELLAGQLKCNEELYKDHAQMFMDRHPKEFRKKATYSKFLAYFSRVGTMAPVFITLQAASDFFKAKIVCISSEEKTVFREFTPHDVDDPEIVWYLALLATEDGHADSVYPQRTPSKSCRHLYDLETLSRVIEEDSS